MLAYLTRMAVLLLLLWGSVISGVSGWLGNQADMLAFTVFSDDLTMDIHLLDKEREQTFRLTHSDENDSQPAWSPDGTYLAFTSDRDGEGGIYIMTATGRHLGRITPEGITASHPVWSPDGRHIAFNYGDQVASVPLTALYEEATSPTRMIGEDVQAFSPSWSPDGGALAFSSRQDGRTALYIADLNAEDVAAERIRSRYNSGWGSWSPDGRYITYQTSVSYYWSLALMDVSSRETKIIYEGIVAGAAIAWSVDSRRIYFTPQRGLQRGIHTIDIETGDIEKVLDYGFQPNQRP